MVAESLNELGLGTPKLFNKAGLWVLSKFCSESGFVVPQISGQMKTYGA